jgi:hypothetical protein
VSRSSGKWREGEFGDDINLPENSRHWYDVRR